MSTAPRKYSTVPDGYQMNITRIGDHGYSLQGTFEGKVVADNTHVYITGSAADPALNAHNVAMDVADRVTKGLRFPNL